MRHDEEREITGPRALKSARRLLPFFRGTGFDLALGIALLAVSSAVALGRPLILRFLIDHAVAAQGAPAPDFTPVFRGAALFVALLIIGVAAGYAQVVVLSRIGLAVVNRIKAAAFRHMLGLDLAFFDRHRSGWLIARVESDAEQLKNVCSHVSAQLLMQAAVFIGILAVLFRTDGEIAGRMSALVTLLMIVIVVYLSHLRRIYDAVRAKYAELTAFISEYVQGVPVIQLYGREAAVRGALARANAERFRSQNRAALCDYGFWAAFTFLTETVLVAIILWSGIEKVLSGAMSVGTVVLFIEYSRQLLQPIHHFSEQFNEIQRGLVASERLFGVLDLKATVVDPHPDDGGRIDFRAIEFRDVGFAYEPGRPVLAGVSFTVRAGEKVAIVGPSGGGKTTLASLLARFYDPTEGEILVDGRPLRDLPLAAWRRSFGLVLQDVQLFPGSVTENLRSLDPAIPEARVAEAAATIGADAVIRRMPGGYDTPLSERGGNLSTGERQLLSFTRALVTDPALLILDEATASIDPATERMIQSALERLLAGRTAVIIAHRLSTVRFADRILVVEGGRVVESGTHAELVAAGGLYRRLHDLQAVPAGSAA